MVLSNRADSIQDSPIRKLYSVALKARKSGIGIYHLNIGQPDIRTPGVFYEAIKLFDEDVLSYGPSDGIIPLKRSMINYFKRYSIDLDIENIIITYGGSEAILFAFNIIGDPGDEIMIPEPFYTNYNGYSTLSNLNIVPIPTKAEEGFHLPVKSEIEKRITPRTKAILICSPNNPTGTIFSEEEVRMVGEIAEENDLYLIADEVYKEFSYDGEKHFSVLELTGLENRVIMVDSISKRYSSCGARIGAFISRNGEIMNAALKFAQARLCPPTLEQLGAEAAYQLPQSYFHNVVKEYQKRRDTLFDILTSGGDIILRKPEGAFYIMAKLPVDDSDKFARWLLEEFNIENETVMVAPGGGFYSSPGMGKQEIRIAYVLESDKLIKASDILLRGIDKYNRK